VAGDVRYRGEGGGGRWGGAERFNSRLWMRCFCECSGVGSECGGVGGAGGGGSTPKIDTQEATPKTNISFIHIPEVFVPSCTDFPTHHQKWWKSEWSVAKIMFGIYYGKRVLVWLFAPLTAERSRCENAAKV
jgi:hypothetical protein